MNNAITSSPWGFRFHRFDRYCRFMKDIGLTDICVQFGDSGKFPLFLNGKKTAVENAGAMAEDQGLCIAEAATSMDYATELPLAAELGAKYFRVCDLWPNTPADFRRVADMLKEMGRMAADHGLIVTVENHGGLVGSAQQCRRLLEEVGRENVTLNYDPANFLYYGEDPVQALDLLFPWVVFVHAKNVKYTDRKPEYCHLAKGVIDYSLILERLQSSYHGYICLEYEKADDVESGTRDDLLTLRSWLERSNRRQACCHI